MGERSSAAQGDYIAPDLSYLGTVAQLTQIACPDPTGKEIGAADGCTFLGVDSGIS